VIAIDNQTVGEMVVEDFARTTVFEKHQIDYCCNGRRTLQEVCEEKGLSLAELTAELEEVRPPPTQVTWATGARLRLRHWPSTSSTGTTVI